MCDIRQHLMLQLRTPLRPLSKHSFESIRWRLLIAGAGVRRRDFLGVLGSAAAAWPLTARAQQSDQVRRVGMLIGYAENDPETQARLAAFRQGLERLGWTEGRNVRIDYRFAPAGPDQAQLFAKELVALRPDVLVGNST